MAEPNPIVSVLTRPWVVLTFLGLVILLALASSFFRPETAVQTFGFVVVIIPFFLGLIQQRQAAAKVAEVVVEVKEANIQAAEKVAEVAVKVEEVAVKAEERAVAAEVKLVEIQKEALEAKKTGEAIHYLVNNNNTAKLLERLMNALGIAANRTKDPKDIEAYEQAKRDFRDHQEKQARLDLSSAADAK